MPKVKIQLAEIKKFTYLKFEGELNLNSFAALHYAVKGATKFGTIPVIIDFSGDLTITDEIKDIKCWRTPVEAPEFVKDVVLVVIGTPERINVINSLLVPHKIEAVKDLDRAIEVLSQ